MLLGIAGPSSANLAVLLMFAVATASVAGLRVPRSERPPERGVSVRTRLATGARAIVGRRGPRLITIGLVSQTVVRGALFVLTVVAAIELLGLGSPGVGLLNAAFGLGGIVGAAAALALTRRSGLAPWFALALAGWGAPIAVIGVVVHPAVALAMLLVVGASNAVLDVAGFTLLQRTTPNRERVPVLGALDSLANAGMALGGAIAPVLVAGLGIEGALVAIGVVLPVVAILSWPSVRHVDGDAIVDRQALERIRADPLFAPLSMAVLEELAAKLRPVAFERGGWIMREGDAGDAYYLIVEGTAAVTQAGVPLRTVAAGSGVGEIALVRDVPRTASVQATTDMRALVLERDSFLDALSGHPASRRTADDLASDRLSRSGAPAR